MDSLIYKYELLKAAIRTGDFSEVIHEIKSHLYTNKNIYVTLTFLIVLYSLYEQDYVSRLSHKARNRLQLGGDKEEGPVQNTIEKPEANTTPKKSNNTDSAKKAASDSNSSGGKASQLAQGASGLCDGNGTIAKMCRGGKDGVYNYFKFFGYLILAGLAVLSPFVIYIVLVYMMLKIMFTGLKNI
jgi:hypothetical protein